MLIVASLRQLGSRLGGDLRKVVMVSAAAMSMAAARKRNAAAGEAAVHSRPATEEATRFPADCTVASKPNAEPRNWPGARLATAALSAVSPQPMPSPASTKAGSSTMG